MPNLQFGTGGAFFTPSNANAPLLTNTTPLSPALLQETSVDFKGDQKMLYGRKQMPYAVARGKITPSGKGKLASFDPMLMNQLFFGMPTTVGGLTIADSEPHALAAATTATVIATNHANFGVDQGVVNASTGIPLTRVLNAPAAGQYTVDNTGTYTFSAAETATALLISYTYTSATGIGFTISSQNMGYAPDFAMILANVFRGKRFVLQLNRCTMTDFSIPTKQDDFWVSDFSYSVSADDAGNVGSIFADQ